MRIALIEAQHPAQDLVLAGRLAELKVLLEEKINLAAERLVVVSQLLAVEDSHCEVTGCIRDAADDGRERRGDDHDRVVDGADPATKQEDKKRRRENEVGKTAAAVGLNHGEPPLSWHLAVVWSNEDLPQGIQVFEAASGAAHDTGQGIVGDSDRHFCFLGDTAIESLEQRSA